MKWAEHAPQARSDFAQPMDPPDSNPLFEYLGGARRERSATKMLAAPSEKKRNML